MLIDTHCHLDLLAEKVDLVQVLNEAYLGGVTNIIIPGLNQHNWATITALSREHDCLYYALGFHPLFIDEQSLAQTHLLSQHLEMAQKKGNKCVAIGECGLDFWSGRENEIQQKELLCQQLQLANKYQLPVILHSRKAHQDMIAILKRYPLQYGGVIHGFSGSFQQAQDYIKLGIFIGVGGVITYDRAQKTRNTIKQISLAHLLLETDAPDMPLSGYQGVENRPIRVQQVLSELAKIRQEKEANVSLSLYHNSKRLFGLC